MDDKARRVLDFLLLRPAFTGRNLFSIFLVMLFIGVYIASGGRVHSVPKIKPGEQFGTIETQQQPSSQEEAVAPTDVIKGLFGKSERKQSNAEDEQGAAVQADPQGGETPAQKLEKLRNRLKQSNQKQ